MNNNDLITLIAISAASLFLWSCSHQHSEQGGHSHDLETHAESKSHADHPHTSPEDDNHGAEHEEGLHLTKEQIQTIGLKFGNFSEIKINDFVKATGRLGLPPNAYASINPRYKGIIKGNKKYVEGNYIRKGEIIAYIENPDFITMQQEFMEALAQLKINRLNFERQQSLVNANAGVEKNLQDAQGQVDILVAKTNGLTSRLNYLGIPTANLAPNNIVQQIAIVSPMSGYISSIDFHNGMYAESANSLMEIIADDHLHLELDVFEKDINKIKKGQHISYVIPALGSITYDGEISVIGKEFNATAKTLRIHGHLKGAKPTFIKDLFINAKIWMNDATVPALPEKAIIKEGASSFIFVGREDSLAAEIAFEKIMIMAGTTDDGFTAVELIDAIPNGMNVVTHGAYFVYAQSMAGELKHEH